MTSNSWSEIVEAFNQGKDIIDHALDMDVVTATNELIQVGEKDTGKVFLEIHASSTGECGRLMLKDFDFDIYEVGE